MKTLNYQEVIEDIDKRLKIFDESRIVKNTSNFYKFSDETLIEKIVDKNIAANDIVLSIVNDDFVAKDSLEKEKNQIDKQKLANFRKNDNFFLENELPITAAPKKETTSFFKSISDFFNDNKKDGKPIIIAKKEVKPQLPQKTNIVATTPILEIELITDIKSQEEIDAVKAVKAEKLRLIEEEYRIKAEKRETEEKLLLEKTTADVKKSTAEFRKNKRKK